MSRRRRSNHTKKGARTKGYIKVEDTQQVERFQYNPSEFSDAQLFKYDILNSPCSNYPVFHYTGSGERTISLQIYVRGSKGEPRKFVKFLESLRAQSRFDMPKIVIFAFGHYVKRCIITEVKREFTEFNEDLSPKEVTISLSLTEVSEV